jgi:hypothetical protein
MPKESFSNATPTVVFSAGRYETPQMVMNRKDVVPVAFGLEALRDARNEYKTALMNAIKIKSQLRNNAEFAHTDTREHFMAGAMNEVGKAGDIYQALFAKMQFAQGSFAQGEHAVVSKLETELDTGKKEWGVRVHKTIKVLALGLGLFAAEGVGDGTRHDHSLGVSGEKVSSQASGTEIVPGVVLQTPQTLVQQEQEDPFSAAAEQIPADSGVTLLYPTDPRLDIPVPTNDWRSAMSPKPEIVTETPKLQLSPEKEVLSNIIPPNWGTNDPGVQFTMPSYEQPLTLGEHDVTPELDIETPLSSHRYTHGEGLWNVVMGTTEIGDAPALVGQTYESRRDIWQKVTEKAKSDPAFRESLGVRISENGDPWIYADTDFNVQAFNQFVIDWKEQSKPELSLGSIEKVSAPSIASIPETIVPPQTVEVETTVAEHTSITGEHINQYRNDFPGGEEVLEDAIKTWIPHAEGAFYVPDRPKSLLTIFSHSSADPYKALIESGKTAGEILTMSKSRSDRQHFLEEHKLTQGGFDTWVEPLRVLDTRYPELHVSTIPFEEVVKLVFIEELLHRQRNAIEL